MWPNVQIDKTITGRKRYLLISTVAMGIAWWLSLLWIDPGALDSWLLIIFSGGVAFGAAFVMALLMWKYLKPTRGPLVESRKTNQKVPP